jgi:hypothetical protein
MSQHPNAYTAGDVDPALQTCKHWGHYETLFRQDRNCDNQKYQFFARDTVAFLVHIITEEVSVAVTL